MATQSLLAVTMGDPAGCGPMITVEAWKALRQSPHRAFMVIGDPQLYDHEIPVEEITTPSEAMKVFGSALPVLRNRIPLSEPPEPGAPNPANASATIESIRYATELAQYGDVSGIVTNPISKAQLYGAGFAHSGHTEFIAEICASHADTEIMPVMMLVGGGLKVALATIHVPLRQAVDLISTELLLVIGRTVAGDLRQSFKIASPRLAFTGLNPHAGESGTIGTEEIDVINPAASLLRAEGVDISDARPADSVFHEALSGDFDAVIAMTHDQGLIPVKTLDLWGGVNVTLGLPIVRTSPDHGTAYDAVRAGRARADSLIAAIKLGAEMAEHRQAENG